LDGRWVKTMVGSSPTRCAMRGAARKLSVCSSPTVNITTAVSVVEAA
jgi:hypothetical protein